MSESIAFRPARPEDAKIASRLLFETFPQKATFIIGLGSEERAKKILEKIFPIPGHRLSYDVTQIAFQGGKVIGLLTAFEGQKIGRLNWKLYTLIFRQYRLRGKLAVFLRGYPLIFIKETGKDEFFLNNLVVVKKLRGKGVSTQLLSYVEDCAVHLGFEKVGLMVNIENKRARVFYQKHAYLPKAIHLESNKRVPYLGAGYQRMQKELIPNNSTDNKHR